MPKKIKLNHLKTNDIGLARRIVLALSMLLLLAVLFKYMQINNKLKEQEAALVSLQHPSNSGSELRISTAFNTQKRDEIASVQKAKSTLNLPWESLFEMLETEQRAEVQLLEISPNPEQAKITITAQADDVNAMLSYVQALSTQPILSKVFLKSQTHNSNQDESAEKSVSFVVEAKWLF